MKRIILIVGILIFFTGGVLTFLVIVNNTKDDKYASFVHDDLKNKKAIFYVNPKGDYHEEYALADITPKDYLSLKMGFYYRVGKDDYILLKEIDTRDSLNDLGFFLDDKYYSASFVVQLNKEKSEFKDLIFNYNDQKLFPTHIQKIDNKSVLVGSYIFSDGHNISKSFICSLENYKCEIKDDN